MPKRKKKIKRCTYCDRVLTRPRTKSGLSATRDHVVPISKGGRKTVLCCLACNNIKADKTPEQWSNYMKLNPKWWRQFKS